MEFNKQIKNSIKIKDNSIEGYLVMFSDSSNPDLERDYFTKNTWFGFESVKRDVPLMYDHGFDSQIGKAQIGLVDLSITNDGVYMKGSLSWQNAQEWQESKLEQQQMYLDAIQNFAKNGLMGASSGALGYLVERKAMNNDTYEITNWTIGEASLTMIPAEPQTISTIKNINTTMQDLYLNSVKRGNVLNKKNKQKLQQIKDIADEVLKSAEKEEIEEQENKINSKNINNTLINFKRF